MAQNETCLLDVDCDPYNTNKLCGADANWLEAGGNGCICNAFYGWTSSERNSTICDELSGASYVSITLYTLLFCWNTVQFYRCVVLFSRRCKNPNAYKGTQIVPRFQRRHRCIRMFARLSATDTTLLFQSMTFFGGMLVAGFTWSSFVANTGTPPYWMATNKDGFGRYEFFSRNIGLPWFGISAALAQLNVCLAWIEAAQAVDTGYSLKATTMAAPSSLIYALESILFVGFVISIFVEGLTGFKLLSLLVFAYAIVLSVLHYASSHLLTHATMFGTHSTIEIPQQLKEMVVDIRKCSRAISFFCCCSSVGSLLYTLLANGGGKNAQITVLNPMRIAHHFVFISLCFTNRATFQYLFPRLSRLKKRSTKGKIEISTGQGSKIWGFVKIFRFANRYAVKVRVAPEPELPKLADELNLKPDLRQLPYISPSADRAKSRSSKWSVPSTQS